MCYSRRQVCRVSDRSFAMELIFIRLNDLITTQIRKSKGEVPFSSLFHNFTANIKDKGRAYQLDIWNNTYDSKKFDGLRLLSYKHADVVLLVYSEAEPSSYVNVTERWMPELKKQAPNVPIILVAIKCPIKCAGNGDICVNSISFEEGLSTSNEIRAAKFVEIHDSTEENFQLLMQQAVQVVGKRRKMDKHEIQKTKWFSQLVKILH